MAKKRRKVDPSITHDKQRQVLELLIELYGDDADPIVNALHEMAARIGIACGIEPETFAAGMKHHWDGIANVINQVASTGLEPGEMSEGFYRRWKNPWN